ncbi:hypothetical protein G3I40_32985 [Streptomyces sp. SID14478]|uniref:hypothetical protein n=1 Tax=Streptomyces sp. SID14478 TaxID=2706073 RepID=UPI0013DADA36|nr:hypothetical protein [Streptomyces sp. SID14478]NEB80001.1 hypothetical protein [Streptomyces sp. SID14478]
MTGIGPVEPYEEPHGPRGDPLAPPTTLVSHPARLSERWAALPPRGRRITLLLAACAAALAVLFVLRAGPADPAPTPWPAQVTTVHYDGPAPDNGAFRFTVTVRSGDPVTLRQLDSWLPELGVSTTPSLPLTVRPGQPATLTVWLAVYACTGLPHGIDLPRLDLVLHNGRGRQQHGYPFDGPFARDVWEFLGANCGPALPSDEPETPVVDPRAGPERSHM